MRHTVRHAGGLFVLMLITTLVGCDAGQRGLKTEVFVMGMIHGDHLSSEAYGPAVIDAMVRAYDPDVVLAEIPPDRLDEALTSYRDSGAVTEPRVLRFPEYTHVIIPQQAELGFTIVPCAAWTQAMAEDRQTKLVRWRETRAMESTEVQRAQQGAEKVMAREGLSGSPEGIHTDRYDALVKQALEPYDRHFNDDLGAGGWTNINAAHYALIDEALDDVSGTGQRVLITFGAWHKYWFLEQLRERNDVTLVTYRDVMRAMESPTTQP
ncbi:MAG: hypothetical protein AAF432_02835 [Planctomycetota bacterium]